MNIQCAGMRRGFILLACAALLHGCSTSESSEAASPLRAVIEQRGLTGDPAAGLDVPNVDDPLAALGRKLFFSKSLGGDRDSACVTCHHPSLGGGDSLPMSIGVGADNPDLLGPGRSHPDGDLTVPRNAPSTFNIGLFERGLFWDSRVEELPGPGIRTPDTDFGEPDPAAGESIVAAQSRFPVTSEDEMRGFEFVQDGTNDDVRAALEQRLSTDGWAAEFEAVFGSPEVTYGRIASAIAAYENSQVFVDTPWRAYIEGDDDAIGESAKRGALLFYLPTADGGANCAGCHSGDFFTDELFWSIAAPQIGRGKGDGATETHDFGRERETGNEADRFTFRTPSLLNVAVSGPFLHSGAYDDLGEVIRHHFDPQAAIAGYDPAAAPGAAANDFDANRKEMLEFLQTSGRVISFFRSPFPYAEQDVEDLVAFLESLTDPCVLDRDCLAPWIADPATDDVDGGLLAAVDGDGNPL